MGLPLLKGTFFQDPFLSHLIFSEKIGNEAGARCHSTKITKISDRQTDTQTDTQTPRRRGQTPNPTRPGTKYAVGAPPHSDKGNPPTLCGSGRVDPEL